MKGKDLVLDGHTLLVLHNVCVTTRSVYTICGLPIAANCIDVVFLTDGRSNDPSLDVCTEIRCLHNRRGVNTFAMELMQELECIVDPDLGLDDYHVFDFLSFDD